MLSAQPFEQRLQLAEVFLSSGFSSKPSLRCGFDPSHS